jgi:ATP-dependent helicase/nuclease subunit A
MAAYRLALGQIYPTAKIHAAIVWTFETRLMPLPGEALDAIQPRLWELAGSA